MSQQFPLNLLLEVGVVFLVLLTAWSVLRTIFLSPLRTVPGPLVAKFTNFYLVYHVSKGNAHELYHKLHQKYGRLVRVGPDTVSVADPEEIPRIYGISSKFNKSAFYNVFTFLVDNEPMHNIFNTRDPDVHRRLKSMGASAYSLTSLKAMEDMIDHCNSEFVRIMKEDYASKPVNLGEWVQFYAFDVIGFLTFSRSFDFMEARGDTRKILQGIEASTWYSSVVGQMPWVHDWLLGSKWTNAILSRIPATRSDIGDLLGKMAYEAMATYESKNDGSKGDLLAQLRQVQAKDPAKLSDRDLFGFIFANLGAGSDTTAIALRAVFYYLMKDNRVYRKLMEEINEADKTGKLSASVTYAEGLGLEYFQVVLKEALRMHPGIGMPLNRSVPPGGAEVCGTYLPAGTTVGISAWVVHRDEVAFGQDADTFRPERWLEASPEQRKMMERSMFTFGAGARTCIGRNISILEMTKFVLQVLRNFELEWASPKDSWDVRGEFFAKQTGVIVRLRARPQVDTL